MVLDISYSIDNEIKTYRAILLQISDFIAI